MSLPHNQGEGSNCRLVVVNVASGLSLPIKCGLNENVDSVKQLIRERGFPRKLFADKDADASEGSSDNSSRQNDRGVLMTEQGNEMKDVRPLGRYFSPHKRGQFATVYWFPLSILSGQAGVGDTSESKEDDIGVTSDSITRQLGDFMPANFQRTVIGPLAKWFIRKDPTKEKGLRGKSQSRKKVADGRRFSALLRSLLRIDGRSSPEAKSRRTESTQGISDQAPARPSTSKVEQEWRSMSSQLDAECVGVEEDDLSEPSQCMCADHMSSARRKSKRAPKVSLGSFAKLLKGGMSADDCVASVARMLASIPRHRMCSAVLGSDSEAKRFSEGKHATAPVLPGVYSVLSYLFPLAVRTPDCTIIDHMLLFEGDSKPRQDAPDHKKILSLLQGGAAQLTAPGQQSQIGDGPTHSATPWESEADRILEILKYYLTMSVPLRVKLVTGLLSCSKSQYNGIRVCLNHLSRVSAESVVRFQHFEGTLTKQSKRFYEVYKGMDKYFAQLSRVTLPSALGVVMQDGSSGTDGTVLSKMIYALPEKQLRLKKEKLKQYASSIYTKRDEVKKVMQNVGLLAADEDIPGGHKPDATPDNRPTKLPRFVRDLMDPSVTQHVERSSRVLKGIRWFTVHVVDRCARLQKSFDSLNELRTILRERANDVNIQLGGDIAIWYALFAGARMLLLSSVCLDMFVDRLAHCTLHIRSQLNQFVPVVLRMVSARVIGVFRLFKELQLLSEHVDTLGRETDVLHDIGNVPHLLKVCCSELVRQSVWAEQFKTLVTPAKISYMREFQTRQKFSENFRKQCQAYLRNVVVSRPVCENRGSSDGEEERPSATTRVGLLEVLFRPFPVWEFDYKAVGAGTLGCWGVVDDSLVKQLEEWGRSLSPMPSPLQPTEQKQPGADEESAAPAPLQPQKNDQETLMLRAELVKAQGELSLAQAEIARLKEALQKANSSSRANVSKDVSEKLLKGT